MTGTLVLNGERYLGAIEGDYVVCCDGGYDKSNRCDAIIGDMDSISSQPQSENIIKLQCEKDLTDGEAGLLYLLDKGYKDIIIYGLNGGRFDHILANVGLMECAIDRGAETVVAKCNDFDAYTAKKKIIARSAINIPVSIAPLSDSVHIMSTKGLKYGIYDFSLKRGSSLSFSNTAVLDEIVIEIIDGKCLLIVNRF